MIKAVQREGQVLLMKELRLYETEQTYISVYNGKVYIKNTQTGEISPRAITLCPGLQIELGRDYREIKYATMQSRVPVFFQEIVKSGQNKWLFIVRMKTGNVPATELVSVRCKDDIIISLGVEQKIKDNMEYQKYLPLPDFCDWMLPEGESEKEKNTREEAAVDFLLKRFPMISDKNIEIETDGNKLDISITHDLVRMKFSLVSSSKEDGRYVCVGIKEL